ncbi:MAG: twin transmembrane helix small protein [Rhodospirillaceae bacterium]|jgi:ABC-type Fe3+-siderophore transport system permease subunit
MVEYKSVMMVVLIVMLALVLGVLITGVIAMAKGGEFNKKYGNKLMRLRVAMQLLAVLLLGGIMLVSSK